MSPVFRSGVFEHGTENVWHAAAVSLHSGVLSWSRRSLILVLWTQKRGSMSNRG